MQSVVLELIARRRAPLGRKLLVSSTAGCFSLVLPVDLGHYLFVLAHFYRGCFHSHNLFVNVILGHVCVQKGAVEGVLADISVGG